MPKKPLDYFTMSYITKERTKGKEKSNNYNEQDSHRSYLNHKSRESNKLVKYFVVWLCKEEALLF